jgi:hypothetical protein
MLGTPRACERPTRRLPLALPPKPPSAPRATYTLGVSAALPLALPAIPDAPSPPRASYTLGVSAAPPRDATLSSPPANEHGSHGTGSWGSIFSSGTKFKAHPSSLAPAQ